jgi:hypothetical protein
MTDWETNKHSVKYLFSSEVRKCPENLRVNTNVRQLSYWELTSLVAWATWRAGFVYQRFRLVIFIMI